MLSYASQVCMQVPYTLAEGVCTCPGGGGGVLDPKWIRVCPHDVARAVGADAKKSKKNYPYGCKIFKKTLIWVKNL